MPISVDHHGQVAIVNIKNPPLNILSVANGTVKELLEAITNELADQLVKGIVLRGSGRCFCAGADIADFENDPAALDLTRKLMETLESSPKPIIVILHGFVLGGGLELALACHHRIATNDAKFGFPEISLGLLPGGGGTQRLPRLVGIEKSIDLILGGQTIDATTALSIGIIDSIEKNDLIEAAIVIVHEILPEQIRRVGQLAVGPEGTIQDIYDARKRLATSRKPNFAASYILDCIEAATTVDFEAGLAIESRLFDELMGSEPSRGLRHAFFADRVATRISGLPANLAEIDFASVGVVGAGTMGIGISLAILAAGLQVILVESKIESLDFALQRITSTLRRDVEKGRLEAMHADEMLSRLRGTHRLGDLSEVDLVIEAVFEDWNAKREVFTLLDQIAKPSAVLASNTSTLDLNRIAQATTQPERVVGMHFFSPANVMKLLEVVRGDNTAPEVLVSAMKFAKKIGKVGVVAGVCDGFIGNRLFEEYLRQVYFLLEDGALPQQIDSALERWGMAMGPIRVMDLAGQDIGWSIRKRRTKERPDRPYSRIPDIICEMGRFGQKTKAGFYLYRDGRTADSDPAIEALIIDHSRNIGVERREVTDEEIISRCIMALVNEGARTVSEGIASRPIDIDAVYVNGYGFPRERGGPMFYADRLGLPVVLNRIQQFESDRQGIVWAPAELLIKLTSRNENFGSLNRK
jgi:3-hydroxyacyl-CoA dehydrogenase